MPVWNYEIILFFIMSCFPKMNGLQGLMLPKSHSFVIAAVYRLKVLQCGPELISKIDFIPLYA